MTQDSKYQDGNVFPLLLIGLALIGIVAATNLINIPQIFKSQADYKPSLLDNSPQTIKDDTGSCGGISGQTCKEGYTCQLDGNYPDASGVCIRIPDQVAVSCDNGRVTLKWQEVIGSTNYTLRINKYPVHWNPDYTGSDAEILTQVSPDTHGDRALEAGNVTSGVVNVGQGFYLGGTVTSTNGSVQPIPEFNCPKKYESCVATTATACAPDNAVFCRQFPNPCSVPADWKEAGPPQSKDAGKVCIQVITPACEIENPTNCRDFPTPCDVPSGWIKTNR